MKKNISSLMFLIFFISGFTFLPKTKINQNKINKTALVKLLNSPEILIDSNGITPFPKMKKTNDRWLKIRTTIKTNEQKDAHVTLNMDDKQKLTLTVNSDKILKDVYNAGKFSGVGALSIYEKNKDNLVLSSATLQHDSYILLKKKGKEKKERVRLDIACKSVFIFEDKSCVISPLGNIEHMTFILTISPWSFRVYKKDKVKIDHIYRYVTTDNPATDDFSIVDLFKENRTNDERTSTQKEINNWYDSKFIFKSNFADVVWANQRTTQKDLRRGFNVKTQIQIDSNKPTPISPGWFWTPLIFLIITPFGYYTFKKFKK